MIAIIVMFLAGVILILAEFFLPGLILGIIGGCLILASCITGVVQYSQYAPFIIGGELLGFFLALFAGFYLITKTRLRNLFILNETMSAEEGFTGPSQNPDLVGQTAKVFSALRPAGTILVDKERIDAVSDGTFIDAGKTVKIITVQGNRVVVEEQQEVSVAQEGTKN
jgi:membrane-bound serine protease (ClpP class)